jgi:N-acetylglutamate synthase-like GNAT family acetyltransferase
MIIIHRNQLSIALKYELNDFILQSFQKSRIDDYEYFVYCKEKGIIVGFAGLYYINNNLSINQLCVHPDYRKKRIATNILQFIKNIYKNSHLILYIDKNKENSEFLHQFYLKNGFKDTETLKFDYDNEFLMEL